MAELVSGAGVQSSQSQPAPQDLSEWGLGRREGQGPSAGHCGGCCRCRDPCPAPLPSALPTRVPRLQPWWRLCGSPVDRLRPSRSPGPCGVMGSLPQATLRMGWVLPTSCPCSPAHGSPFLPLCQAQGPREHPDHARPCENVAKQCVQPRCQERSPGPHRGWGPLLGAT